MGEQRSLRTLGHLEVARGWKMVQEHFPKRNLLTALSQPGL